MTVKKYCDSMLMGSEILRSEVTGMEKDPIACGIKSLIVEKGMIQKAVAQRAGYTQQQFSDMLNNRKVIKAVDLIPISKALGVGVQEIYDAGRVEA